NIKNPSNDLSQKAHFKTMIQHQSMRRWWLLMACMAEASAGVLGVTELDLSSPKLRLTPSPSNSAERIGSVQKVLVEIAETEVKVSDAHETPEPQGPLDADLVPVLFVLRTTAEDVVVVGSWTDWKGHFKLIRHLDDVFQGWVDVPVGTHQFKFITDGHWITSDDFPIEVDEAGNSNNILSVPAAPRSQSPAADGGNDILSVPASHDDRLGAVGRHSHPAVLAPASGDSTKIKCPPRSLSIVAFPFN
ncbi:MAG: glycogen-binding domain-containing protein, partial [Dolichospermum sp.]